MSVLSISKLKQRFKLPNNIKAQAIYDLIDTIVDKTILGLQSTADVTFASTTVNKINLLEQSAEPDDPIGGVAVIYMSDGSVSDEAAGDIMMKISSPAGSGAVTKKVVLVDFSAA